MDHKLIFNKLNKIFFKMVGMVRNKKIIIKIYKMKDSQISQEIL